MDVSKLDAGAIAPKRMAFALEPLFERLDREFGPLAAAKGLRFRVAGTRMRVESDPVLLERILANLASNAVRYTERGGVVIAARRRSSRVALEAWDSGVGIAAEETERIFEEFYQVGNPGARGGQGMGLGLAIIRRLATLLGHPVRVRSKPGKGSCFSVDVPRARHAESADPSMRLEDVSPAALAGVCVAVIDDEEIVLQGMGALLSAWGARVIGASSCDAMLAALGEAESYPDLIIADYRIGHRELGTDAITRLRHELGVPIPALLISGDSAASTLETLRRSGLDFLLKPVLPEELKARASRLLGRLGSLATAAGQMPDPKSASAAGVLLPG
jgi:CheY-like chemotaxis protein/anti-sigma regulatory factor (Ser/Thr protein kinase)